MCGIVAAITNDNTNIVVPILQCLKKLEYRGYDSAGVAAWNKQNGLQRVRTIGKVDELIAQEEKDPLRGGIAIAHTRWATHGAPSERNSHPHISHDQIAVVHNGIVENYAELKCELLTAGYHFSSDTDTEVVAHLLHSFYQRNNDFLAAVHQVIERLQGSFALAILNSADPDKLIAVRHGSPLVIGLGDNLQFLASDAICLLEHTNNFIYLDEGDIALITKEDVSIYDAELSPVKRKIKTLHLTPEAVAKNGYDYYMMKEIFEQPQTIKSTLQAYSFPAQNCEKVVIGNIGESDPWLYVKKIANKINKIQIVACGSSYYVGMVGSYWGESLANIPCSVDTASEFRYRDVAVSDGTLLITISQSGETADTLAALRWAKDQPYLARIAICNAAESSLVREADATFMTYTGIEVGVATTKAFTAQLVVLFLLLLELAREKGVMTQKRYEDYYQQVKHLPFLAEQTLLLENKIHRVAERFVAKEHAFYLGRGMNYPIALEGALKLKEISYLHAEAYPAGELKHGPLALVDANIPVVILAPYDKLWDKIKGNIHEVMARGGEVIMFSDNDVSAFDARITAIKMPKTISILTPILYVLPLQLLAYYVALLRGNNVDQPRNLAKSVTVE